MSTYFVEDELDVLERPANPLDLKPIGTERGLVSTKLIITAISVWHRDVEFVKMCSTFVEFMPYRVQLIDKNRVRLYILLTLSYLFPLKCFQWLKLLYRKHLYFFTTFRTVLHSTVRLQRSKSSEGFLPKKIVKCLYVSDVSSFWPVVS